MNKNAILILFFLFTVFNVAAQKIKSPSEFLGYKLGDQFTPHHRIVDYYNYLSSVSKQIKLQEYGKTNEGRPLLLAFIASENNINRLDEIRKNNLSLAGINEKGTATTNKTKIANQPVIVWLSYNVHGNESVSTEASLQTVYELLNPENLETKSWLTNTLVLLDPCLNPDGRERYVNFYNPIRNIVPDASPFTREHMEPWPGGRANHYYFDLNRDWAWQSQVESQQRLAVYNKWLPQVHVDFHEQGVDEPYYFAPAAEPFHEDISTWQREFQTIIGKNNARYFDAKAWMYFTKERFDLLYPSYGDTYPIYNGSVGMTFEQGGSGRAGLAIINSEGDTLTLKDRIDHHFTSGLSTVEASSKYAERALTEFSNYFSGSNRSPAGVYKSYILRGDNPEKLKSLAILLNRNGIDFGYGASKSVLAYNYFTGKNETVKVNKGDIVISAYQAKSVLLKVLLEPNTFVSDSATYDITAWSLPYAFGIQAFASKESLSPLSSTFEKEIKSFNTVENPVAYISNWNSVTDVKFLADLLKKNIKVRFSEIPFESGANRFAAGSLIITRNGNLGMGSNFENVINELAKENGIDLVPMASGFVDKGADLGSDKVRLIKRPKVVVVGGESTSSLAFGEVWHFFEQQINYPISIVLSQDLNRMDWSEINVLILPSGNYSDLANDKLMQWIRGGGKLIAMGNAVSQLADVKGFGIKNKDDVKKDDKESDSYKAIKSYQNRERASILNNTPGAIYKVDLDNSHPLGFGFPSFYYSLKLDDKVYQYLNDGWNVGVIKKDNYVSGFVGSEAKKKIADGLIFGVQDLGNGSVVYLGDNPLFRSFWESGKLLFGNAVFMVGN
jgi:hypothetical protein